LVSCLRQFSLLYEKGRVLHRRGLDQLEGEMMAFSREWDRSPIIFSAVSALALCVSASVRSRAAVFFADQASVRVLAHLFAFSDRNLPFVR